MSIQIKTRVVNDVRPLVDYSVRVLTTPNLPQATRAWLNGPGAASKGLLTHGQELFMQRVGLNTNRLTYGIGNSKDPASLVAELVKLEAAGYTNLDVRSPFASTVHGDKPGTRTHQLVDHSYQLEFTVAQRDVLKRDLGYTDRDLDQIANYPKVNAFDRDVVANHISKIMKLWRDGFQRVTRVDGSLTPLARGPSRSLTPALLKDYGC